MVRQREGRSPHPSAIPDRRPVVERANTRPRQPFRRERVDHYEGRQASRNEPAICSALPRFFVREPFQAPSRAVAGNSVFSHDRRHDLGRESRGVDPARSD